jgi:membrane-bound lytic murein transglycosylase B
VRIPGGSGARSALEGACRRLAHWARTPAFGLVVVAVAVLLGAAGAAPGAAALGRPEVREAGVLPLAAVTPNTGGDQSGPAVISVHHPPTSFHIAAATISAPPPSAVVNSPGALRIPVIVLKAYRNAERMMAAADPGCGISWNLLAGIGRIESMHANGGAVDAQGTAVWPIMGPVLDGSLPGNEVILQSRGPSGVTYARALGPMQFLPGTWARFASDAKGNGQADVQNVFDASLAAARYLCSGGLNLRDPSQVMAAVLRYNNSMPYAQNVLGWAAAYSTGVIPDNLPPLTGPVPPIGDAHLEDHPEGLGPGLPMNAEGLPPTDPLALLPVQFGRPDALSTLPTTAAGMDPAATGAQDPALTPGCTLVCGQGLPPWMSPPPTMAPNPGDGLPPGPLPGPAQYVMPSAASQPPTAVPPAPGPFGLPPAWPPNPQGWPPNPQSPPNAPNPAGVLSPPDAPAATPPPALPAQHGPLPGPAN